MCGFAGYFSMRHGEPPDDAVVLRMTNALLHRGPDSAGWLAEPGLRVGFRRLSIVDIAGGDQPLFNEDRSVAVLCNGEIFNHRELRAELLAKGHQFKTASDIEVIAHLYEEHGVEFVDRLNGQFACILYDRRRACLHLIRDQLGIQPLFYTTVRNTLLFASEVGALLQYDGVGRRLNLTALDQLVSFPGFASPLTMFRDIRALAPGHRLEVTADHMADFEYWDLIYPEAAPETPIGESEYIERFSDLFIRSVQRRLQADVPVGLYFSGGLDSSLTAATAFALAPDISRHLFSVTFDAADLSERPHQAYMATRSNAIYHEERFDPARVVQLLAQAVRHSEAPLKESYNTCSLALSHAAHTAGIKVALTSEGADELFAGYVGYKFDSAGLSDRGHDELAIEREREFRTLLWGDPDLFYERNLQELQEIKRALYAQPLAQQLDRFDACQASIVNRTRLSHRHWVHQRAYLDTKFRLSDHLLADHGDRMAMANSVEARYPFLDIELIQFSTTIPPQLKIKDFTEKYLIRQAAKRLLPAQIAAREKFEFRGPTSFDLIKAARDWAEDLLAPERLRRDGVFNPRTVDRLKQRALQPDAKLHFPFEQDFLMIVLTFGIFRDLFGVSL